MKREALERARSVWGWAAVMESEDDITVTDAEGWDPVMVRSRNLMQELEDLRTELEARVPLPRS